MASLEVIDEAAVRRLPAEPLTCEGARGRGVEPKEHAHPAEMVRCVLRGDRDDRHIEVAANDLGDVTRGDGFGDSVERRAGRAVLERETVEPGCIEPVHGRPAVGAIADVRGRALPARDVDQDRDEAVIALAVHRCSGSHDR